MLMLHVVATIVNNSCANYQNYVQIPWYSRVYHGPLSIMVYTMVIFHLLITLFCEWWILCCAFQLSAHNWVFSAMHPKYGFYSMIWFECLFQCKTNHTFGRLFSFHFMSRLVTFSALIFWVNGRCIFCPIGRPAGWCVISILYNNKKNNWTTQIKLLTCVASHQCLI